MYYSLKLLILSARVELGSKWRLEERHSALLSRGRADMQS